MESGGVNYGMFQDSNKEYTGSGTGVAGNNPATPVTSLSAQQEVAVQAATLAALQQLQERRATFNVEAARAQLYELASQTILTQQGSLDVAELVDRWQQGESVSVLAAKQTSSTAQGAIPKPEAKSLTLSGISSEGGLSDSTPAGLTDKPIVDAAVDGSDQELASANEVAEGPVGATENAQSEINEPDAGNLDGVAAGDEPAPDFGTSEPSVEVEPASDGPAIQQSENKEIVSEAPEKTTRPTENETVNKSASGERAENTKDAPASSSTTSNGAERGAAKSSQQAMPVEAAGPAGSHGPGAAESGRPSSLSASEDQAASDNQGLPKGTRDRFKRGLEDRRSGKGFREGYSGQKIASGSAKSVGEGLAGSVAKEAGKDVAKAATKEAGKEAAKVTAKVAAESSPVGVITDIDLKGAIKGAKELKDLHVVKAYKDLAGSVWVTVFRLSYDPWVIGWSAFSSLIVTLLVGSILFFVPGTSMSFLEKLLVVALWLLLFFIILFALALLVLGLCNGPTGWAIWAASWFSQTAADVNKFCEPIGALQAASKNIAR